MDPRGCLGSLFWWLVLASTVELLTIYLESGLRNKSQEPLRNSTLQELKSPVQDQVPGVSPSVACVQAQGLLSHIYIYLFNHSSLRFPSIMPW